MNSLERIVSLVRKMEKKKQEIKSLQAQLLNLTRGPKPHINLDGSGVAKKVLACFQARPKSPMTIVEVMQATGLSKGSANGALHRLVAGGVLQRERRGFYRLVEPDQKA